MPGTYNLVLYRGDTYRWDFKFWQDEARTIPVNLDGYKVAAEIRNEPGGSCVTAMSLDVELPNIVHAELDASSSGVAQSGVWDLQLTDPAGDVRTVLRGSVAVTDDVTDSDR